MRHQCSDVFSSLRRVLLPVALQALLGTSTAAAGDAMYPVSTIPSGLRKEAHAVIREYHTVLEVRDRHKARERVTRVTTIFSQEGRKHGTLVLPYDRLNPIEELEGVLYDASGKEIRDLEDKDTRDYSAITGFRLYDDTRIRIAELYYDRYPYTVAYTYEMSYDGYLGFPTWYAQEEREPVEQSVMEVILPAEDSLRFWTNNPACQPVVTNEDGTRRYLWQAKNLPELSTETMEEDIEHRTSIVRLAPRAFELEGHAGDMSSWEGLGRWTNALYEGRNVLPESARRDVQARVSGIALPRERVAVLYKYMQERTRYVSVQLGIGGWQPYDATYVHEKGYGDCKALANYMVSLLQEAGVRAYPALINTEGVPSHFIPEFPSQQFNHVIVCVPLEKDSLWLECTSQTTPAGKLGQGTENRMSLILAPEGAKLVRTPSSSAQDNMQVRKAHVQLLAGGNAKAHVTTSVTGNQQDYLREMIAQADPDKCREWLTDRLEIPNIHLRDYHIENPRGGKDTIAVVFDLDAERYASYSGSRLFFMPNLTERRTMVPMAMSARRSPVHFGYPYLDQDSVWYQMPEGYRCESLPKEATFTSAFGVYRAATVQVDKQTLLFTRSLEIKDSEIPPTMYGNYREFFSNVVKADRAQVVLVRQ